MSEASYRYWTAECKTPDCGVLLLARIGVADPFKIPFLQECRDFRITCAGCMKEYLYSRNDVSWGDRPVVAEFQDSQAFLAAIRPLPHQDEPPAQ
jgi:molybdenum cofactor biosynthesis enzyme MoaA